MSYKIDELLLLENLTYLSDNPPLYTMHGADGKTVGEFINNLYLEQLIDDKDYGSFIYGLDWKNILEAVKKKNKLLDLKICETHLDMAYGGGYGYSMVFLDKKNKEAVVAFRGTATNEWTDDFEGANLVDTLQQINCLEWYKLIYNRLHLEDYYITVIGHSKGGNKAKYITILNDTVNRCVSFDGQGFSDKFIEHYKDRILKRQDIIENHNIDYDYVNILMNDIGKKSYYYGYNYRNGFTDAHCSNRFFDFSDLGVYQIKLNPNGQAKEMQVLSQFINSMIRSAYNDKERSKNNKLVGTLVEKAFSIGAKEISSNDFIVLLCDMIGDREYLENTSYLLSYVIKYSKENKQFLEAVKSILRNFNAEDLCKTIDMISDLINSKKLNAILSISNFLISHVNKVVVNKIQSIAKKKYDVDLSKEQIQKVLQLVSMVKVTLKTLEINFDGSDLIAKNDDSSNENLLDSLNIVVLTGGLSNERNISLNTGYMVSKELSTSGHNVILLDSYMGYGDEEIQIDDAFSDKERYSLVIDSIQDDIPDLWAVKKRRKDQSESYFGPNVIQICKQADLVFIALHGSNGENGKVQAMFDLLGIDYTGPDYFSSSLSSNKMISKNTFIKNNLPVPKGYTIKKNQELVEPMEYNINYPVIVKPNNGGISIGISVANNKEELIKSANKAFKWENEILIEEYIEGREFSVGIIDKHILPILEVLPLKSKTTSINEKLDCIKSKRCPADISDEIKNKLQEAALNASLSLGLDKYSLTDFIVKDDGSFVILECESLPELNPHSYLAFMANEEGISFSDFCHKIIELSI